MADIVISGQKFKIAGEQPTAQEQLAIDTFWVQEIMKMRKQVHLF